MLRIIDWPLKMAVQLLLNITYSFGRWCSSRAYEFYPQNEYGYKRPHRKSGLVADFAYHAWPLTLYVLWHQAARIQIFRIKHTMRKE